MTAPATARVNQRAVEAIIERLIELLDTVDANSVVEAGVDCEAE